MIQDECELLTEFYFRIHRFIYYRYYRYIGIGALARAHMSRSIVSPLGVADEALDEAGDLD
jgi:hypothetical protein